MEINEFMLGAIAAGTHQLTPANIDDHLEQLIDVVTRYQIFSSRS